MKGLLIVSILVLLVMPFVYADIIEPGEHPVIINSKITNLANFPDYVFISGGSIMCNFVKVGDDGTIQNCYKLSPLNVYAIPKDKYSDNFLTEWNNASNNPDYFTSIENIIYSIGGKKVLEDIEHSKVVPDSNPITEINNAYVIDLNQTETNPGSVNCMSGDDTINCNPGSPAPANQNLIYIYIIIPVIALIILFIILIRRQRKNANS